MADTAAPSMVCGAELARRPDLPVTLLAGIRRRLDRCPEARLWTIDDQGQPVATLYADLWPRADAIAAGLDRARLAPGAVIAALVTSPADLVAVFWACLMGGHVLLPLSGRARRARDSGRVEDIRALIAQLPDVHIMTDADSAVLLPGTVDLAAVERSGRGAEPVRRAVADPVCWPVCWLPTSGATGRDKLAALSETALLARRFHRRDSGTTGAAQMWLYDPDSVAGLNACFVHAADWVQIPPSFALARPERVLDIADQLKVRRIALTSSLAQHLATSAARASRTWNLQALTRIGLGGETIDPAVARRLHNALARHGAFVRLSAGYGTTETGSLVTGGEVTWHQDCEATVSLGRPAMGVRLRIVAEDGTLLPDGETGVVEAWCPDLIFSGYADASGDAAGFRPDGWWRTGDLGRLRDGHLSLHGRVKQMIVVRGRKLALDDIDTALATVVPEGRAVAGGLGGGDGLGIMLFGADTTVERAIRRVMGERFGIQPASIVHATADALPLGASGKVLRARIADMMPGLATVDTRLAALWRECLPLSDAKADSHFFEDGGDSLAAQALFAGLEARLGVKLRPAAFFADPTLHRLGELTSGTLPSTPDLKWPLPPAIHDKLLVQVETWPGTRPTDDRLMAALNVTGTRPPLFWVFQSAREFAALAAQLGPDQPVYALRSGHGVYRYDEDSLQAIALRYVQDVLAVCPAGPLFIGGNCQGGRVALTMAGHLLRRQVHVPLLILMEWGFELAAYSGDVVFLHGADSLEGHPHLRHAEPERAWKRMLRRVKAEVIPGKHGQYFLPANVPELARIIRRRLAIAVKQPAQVLPALARKAGLHIASCPATLAPGETVPVAVTIRNASPVTWPEGLSLGNYWLDTRGRVVCWRDGRVPLPSLPPGDMIQVVLDIAAPLTPGPYNLAVDVVEEGGRWFDRSRRTIPMFAIEVVSQSVTASPT